SYHKEDSHQLSLQCVSMCVYVSGCCVCVCVLVSGFTCRCLWVLSVCSSSLDTHVDLKGSSCLARLGFAIRTDKGSISVLTTPHSFTACEFIVRHVSWVVAQVLSESSRVTD